MENERLTYTIPEASEKLGISRNLGYLLAASNSLPVPVIRLGGKRMVVSRRALDRLLDGSNSLGDNHEGNG